MSNNLFEPAQPQDGPPESGDVSANPDSPYAAAPKSSRGRTIALVGGVLAIVAVGAGGAFAFQQLGGGGAQPESVVPATAFGFVKVDLDPSAGQKLDAIRFARKFPEAKGKVEEDSDLREVIFKAIQDDGDLKGIDYAKDVKPWLGQRFGMGVVPGAAAGAEPVGMIAMSVTDKDAAKQSLPKIATAMEGACQLVKDYAVCTEKDKDALPGIVKAAEKGSLADSKDFSKDMADLGEDGVASAWVDLKQASTHLGDAAASPLGLGKLDTGAAGGRLSVALRFDGPHLELAGHVNDIPNKLVGTQTAASIAKLPKGTLAATTVANAGDQLKASWPELEKSLKSSVGEKEFADGLAQVQDALGVKLPDDLAAALGSQFSVAFGGMGEGQSDIKVALVSNGDKAALKKFADAAGQGMGAGELALKTQGSTTVLSLSDGYADEIASGSGLGDTPGFKDAMKGVDKSRVALYVDIAGMLNAFKDEIPASQAKNFASLGSLGITAGGEGTSADFRLRLTTK